MLPVFQAAPGHADERGEISHFRETLEETAKELQTATGTGMHLSSIPVISHLVMPTEHGTCLTHCCRSFCCPYRSCFLFGLH